MPNFKLIQDAGISDAKASAHVAGKNFDDFDIREVLDEVAGSESSPMGTIFVTYKPTGRACSYGVGSGLSWSKYFARDLVIGSFDPPRPKRDPVIIS